MAFAVAAGVGARHADVRAEQSRQVTLRQFVSLRRQRVQSLPQAALGFGRLLFPRKLAARVRISQQAATRQKRRRAQNDIAALGRDSSRA